MESLKENGEDGLAEYLGDGGTAGRAASLTARYQRAFKEAGHSFLLRDAKPKAAEKALLIIATGVRIVAVIKRVGMVLRKTGKGEAGSWHEANVETRPGGRGISN